MLNVTQIHLVAAEMKRRTDRQTDGQTDKQTDMTWTAGSGFGG
jgi:hypothetical protein